jgi:hypothetical protein
VVTSGLSKIRNYDIEDDLLEGFLREIGTGVITSKSGVWRSEGARIYNPVRVSGPIESNGPGKKDTGLGARAALNYSKHKEQ